MILLIPISIITLGLLLRRPLQWCLDALITYRDCYEPDDVMTAGTILALWGKRWFCRWSLLWLVLSLVG